MLIRADLHIHGRYSMATSKNMVPSVITSQGRIKGLQLIGTGDAFHGGWLDLIQKSTEECGEGFYRIREECHPEEDPDLKSNNPEPLLVLTAEVEDSKRVHHLLILPSIDVALEMRQKLKGNLESDGRPRVRMKGAEIQSIAQEYDCLWGPSHAFTPWTGIYKAYDSVYDCYTAKPDFLELGLSADTDMADRIEELQDIPFITNSDAHSPWPHRLGREFNEMNLKKMDYGGLQKAIGKCRIETNFGFDPRMGKYHLTACSKCYKLYPVQEAIGMNMKCSCGGNIKKGVDYRIEELSTWKEPHHPKHRPPYIHILPLAEIISLVYDKGVTTVFVQKIWKALVQKFSDEISVLIYTPLDEIKEVDPKIVPLIESFRNGTLQMSPGGGGRYGEMILPENNTLDKYF